MYFFISELNKMLEDGPKGKQPENVPSTTPTEKTDSSGTEVDEKLSQQTDDGVKADEKSEEKKIPGLGDLLKETSDDVKPVADDQKDDTEIADETEIGDGESITNMKQEVVENAGKEVDSQLPGGVVEPSMTDKDSPPTGQGNTEAGIQPSSVIQDKKEENSLTEEGSSSQSVEQKASIISSTPGLTEIPSSVTEASTVDSVSQQTAMEGFTIIDGTPFPLDMFDDPTPTGNVAKPTQSDILSSTPTQQFTSSVLVDEPIKSESTEDVKKQTATQFDTVTKPLEQSPDSSLLPTQTEIITESVNVDSGSSTAIVPTQTEAVAESTKVSQDSVQETSESIQPKDVVPEPSEEEKGKHTERHVEEASKSEDLTDLEKSSSNVDSKVEDVPTDGSEKEKEDKAKPDNTQVDQTETKIEENVENITAAEKKVEDGEQKSLETPPQNGQEPDMSALKFLDDEDASPNSQDTSPDSPSNDENVKEMNVPAEEVKTTEEGKQSQMSDEMTDKPIQEKTAASAVPSTSPVEQLMSSMESDYSVDSKEMMDNTRNTAVVGNQQNATQTVVDTENLKIDLPSTVDAYATADFLSRKPLSHDPHKVPESVKQEGKPEDAAMAGEAGEQKDAVTQAPPVSTTQVEAEKPSSADTGNVEENKQETVTESPLVATTQSGSNEAEIPPPPTESKDTTTQSSTAQPAGEPGKGAEDTPDSVTTPDSVVSTQDIQPSSAETAGVTSAAAAQGDQADTSAYSQSEFSSRKINDGDLEEQEDLAYKAERPWMKSDQFLKWFITKVWILIVVHVYIIM
jgi:hypothetical protein